LRDSFLAIVSLIKLSELPESMSAVSSIPPIETFTDACFRLSGQLATIEQRVGVNIPGVPKKSTPVCFIITSKQVKLSNRNNLH
jgi:hypothetical protein